MVAQRIKLWLVYEVVPAFVANNPLGQHFNRHFREEAREELVIKLRFWTRSPDHPALTRKKLVEPMLSFAWWQVGVYDERTHRFFIGRQVERAFKADIKLSLERWHFAFFAQ